MCGEKTSKAIRVLSEWLGRCCCCCCFFTFTCTWARYTSASISLLDESGGWAVPVPSRSELWVGRGNLPAVEKQETTDLVTDIEIVTPLSVRNIQNTLSNDISNIWINWYLKKNILFTKLENSLYKVENTLSTLKTH